VGERSQGSPLGLTRYTLVPEAVLRERAPVIRVATTDAAAGHTAMLDGPGGIALRYHLLFADASRAHTAGFNLDAAALFYNQYYWFKRFVNQHAALAGYDAGLEQQASKLLEAAPEDVDWSVIEALDAQAAR
jgi:hypothetical protein